MQQFLVDVVTVRFSTFSPLIYIVSSGGSLIASSVPGLAIQLSPEEGGFFSDRSSHVHEQGSFRRNANALHVYVATRALSHAWSSIIS